MKHHLRKEMKAKLAAMSDDEIASRSYAACEALLAQPEYRNARTIMLYLPIRQEVDTAEIALHAWQAGKTVLAPKVDWEQKHMLGMRISSLDDGLVYGQHSIREPAGGTVWPPEEIDFVIVPALAYDRSGGRLGRGGGFYDRFLAQRGMRAVKCGLGFDIQLVDELPTDGHDHPIDLLVTDKCVLRFESDDSTKPEA